MAGINETHRAGTIKGALHIAEHSQASSIDKINAICLALYPDDVKAIEAVLITTLKQLAQKA
jgi:hypothetical protein